MGFIDIGVLVDEGVARVVPDELNRHVQLILAAHAVAQGGHLRPTGDGVRPAEAGNLRFDRVIRQRHTFDGDGVGGLTRAAVPAVDPDVPGEDRQHRDSAGGQLAVRLALRSPALADISRFSRADFPGKLNDAIGGNTGDAGGPLRRFRRVVIALAENIRFVVTVSRRAFRQRFFVIADAVFVEERLVDQVFVD